MSPQSPQSPQHDSETLAEGKQVMTAVAFIHRESPNEAGVSELFLARRAATKKFLPGVLELPGGHIDFGESPIAGLKREIKEEFGMEISVGGVFHAFDYTNPIKKSHSFELIYFAKFESDPKNIKLDPADHSEYIWVDEQAYLNLAERDPDDPEHYAVMRGFELLRGVTLNFGYNHSK